MDMPNKKTWFFDIYHTDVYGTSCGTSTIGKTKDQRDKVDMPQGVEGWNLCQHQHQDTKNNNKLVKFHGFWL